MTRALSSPRHWLLAGALVAQAVLLAGDGAAPAQAQPSPAAGSLDLSFGDDGKATTSAVPATGRTSKINAVAALSGGKILAAGSSYVGIDLDMTLVRYNADGSLDTTFGEGDGKVTTDFHRGADTVYAVEELSDGKILAAGYTRNSSGKVVFALARYTADGVLDTSFGTGGKVTTAVGSSNDHIWAMAVQSDGKIVVAGSSYNGSNDDIAVVRYTAAGALDTTFGGDGKVTTPIGSSADLANAVAVQSDGKIVVAGYSWNGSNDDIAVVRYTAAGALDTTFGGDADGDSTPDGYTVTAVGSTHDRATGVAVLSDGKILLGGHSSSGSPSFADLTLVRYTAAGALDTTFGTGGKVVTPISSLGDDFGNAMLLQSDGKILLGGSTATRITAGTVYYGFILARYTAAGALDTTFGTVVSGSTRTGHVTTPIGSGNDRARGLALQSDGKILLAGFSHNGSHEDFALARYTSTGVLDTSFDSDGKVTTAMSSSYDSFGYSVALQSDGKIVMAGDAYNGTTNQSDFALARFDADGTVDMSFGSDGKVTTDFQSGANDYGNAVAIQSDGKIVVSGRSYGTARDFALARYTTAGALDMSFGTGGKVTTDFNSGEDRPYALAVQSDGKIVVAGYAHNGSDNEFALARYTTAGALDTSFGTGGKVTTDFGSSNDRARALAVQSDGKIVVAGGIGGDFGVARYTAAGALDTTFGGDADSDGTPDGYVTTTMSSGDDTALGIALQSDGKIVATGAAIIAGDYDFALARYTADGSLDTSFGTVSGSSRTGYVTTPMSDHRDIAYGILLQSDGRIVIAGWAGATAGGSARPLDFALARYDSDGSLDTTFGAGGKVTTPFGPGDDRAYSAVLQDDGKIVAAGFARPDKLYEFALARYLVTSSNNNLSALTASSATGATATFTNLPLSPAFSAGTAGYTASVAHSITHVKLTPTVEDTGKATVQVGKSGSLATVADTQASAAVELDVGTNAIVVRVTAEDETTRDYTVTITRQEATTAPGAVRDLRVAEGDTWLEPSWSRVSNSPPHVETGYDVHYTSSQTAGDDDAAGGSDASAGWVDANHQGGPSSPRITHRLSGLANDVEHRVRVRATNAAGEGPWTHGRGTPAEAVLALPAGVTVREGGGEVAFTGTLSVAVSERTPYSVRFGAGSQDIRVRLSPVGRFVAVSPDTHASIPAGGKTFRIGVTATDDGFPEATETTVLTVVVDYDRNGAYGDAGDLEATIPVTIEDNDANAVVLTPDSTTLTEGGGYMNVTLTLRNPDAIPDHGYWVRVVASGTATVQTLNYRGDAHDRSWDYRMIPSGTQSTLRDGQTIIEQARTFHFTQSAKSHTLRLIARSDDAEDSGETIVLTATDTNWSGLTGTLTLTIVDGGSGSLQSDYPEGGGDDPEIVIDPDTGLPRPETDEEQHERSSRTRRSADPETPEPETPEPETPDAVVGDTNGDGTVDAAEYRQALSDYHAGTITYEEMIQIAIAASAEFSG